MQAIYGEGNHTVPGMLVDGEPVHGSRAILARLEELVPEPALYPSEEVREAERWGDEELQDLGRRMSWGALHFRPEALGTFGGAVPLDGARHRLRDPLRARHVEVPRASPRRACRTISPGFPTELAHVEATRRGRVIGGEQPNAADLQIGSTLRVLLTVGDLRPLLAGGAGEQIARDQLPGVPR